MGAFNFWFNFVNEDYKEDGDEKIELSGMKIEKLHFFSFSFLDFLIL